MASAKEPSKTRRGRRPAADGGEGAARASIVAAAQREFMKSGYDGASMRAIAREANVDPALVHHYFSDKADLFAESISAPLRPDQVVGEVLRGPRDQIGVGIIRNVVARLNDERARSVAIGLLRTGLGHEFAARMLRQFLLREVLHRITTELDLDDGELRASFAASQIVGLIVARYGIRLGPLAEASDEQVIARVGAVVQWHLLGDVPDA